MISPRRSIVEVSIGVIVGVALVASVAVANVPDNFGVLHACYRNAAPHQMIIGNGASNKNCPTNWTAIEWPQAGPVGPSGVTGATGLPGAGGVSGARGLSLNLRRVAVGRWYGFDHAVTDSSLGPIAAEVFDGEHLWIAEELDSKLVEIDPSSGSVIATYATPGLVYSMLYDGAHLWLVSDSNFLSELNPTNGSIIRQIQFAGSNSYYSAMAFDGTHLWIADFADATVSEINPLTGGVLSIVNVADGPTSLAFDGSNLWVANYLSNDVQEISPSSDLVTATLPVLGEPIALQSDGTSLWVANFQSSDVQRIDEATATVTGAFSVGDVQTSLTYDGTDIWATTTSGVARLNATTGARDGVDATGGTPTTLAFDGAYVWVGYVDVGGVDLRKL